MIYGLLVGALVVAVVVYLVWPGQGLGVTWASAPGGPLRFRIRLNSVIPRLLGSDGTSLFGVAHIRGKQASAYLLAHEVGHCLRARGNSVGYLWRYLTSSSFRAAEEGWCHAFGLTHRHDPFLASLAQRLEAK